MAIVDVHNKERGVTYVYESFSYWDKEKKQPRSHRRLIGKRDPETGEIIPTGGRGKKDVPPEHSDTEPDYKSLYERAESESRAKDERVLQLTRKVASLEIENARCRDRLERIRRIAE